MVEEERGWFEVKIFIDYFLSFNLPLRLTLQEDMFCDSILKTIKTTTLKTLNCDIADMTCHQCENIEIIFEQLLARL